MRFVGGKNPASLITFDSECTTKYTNRGHTNNQTLPGMTLPFGSVDASL